MKLSFYTNSPSENGGTYGGEVLTKTGYNISNTIKYQGMGIVASDNDYLPLHSIIHIEGLGKYIVLDTGGAIKSNKLDVLVGSSHEARQRGVYNEKITVIRWGKGE